MRLPDLGRLAKRKNGPEVSREEALGAQPVRNPAITWEVQDNGRVLLQVPMAVKPWMRLFRLLVTTPDHRMVELDEVGSDVWQWCDGEATVRDLVKRLAREHQLNPREAEVSLTQFLQTLAKRRFLGLRLTISAARGEAMGAAAANTDNGGSRTGRGGKRKRA
ncbi:MAG: PqqD family protein [Armatimonadetes bacterium]|nr:PqqD family protein [Armatimonadota bacterium]